MVSSPFAVQTSTVPADATRTPGRCRPLKFKTAEELTKKAEKYFRRCRAEGDPITITGLCLELDTFLDVIWDYGRGRYDAADPDFSKAVKRVRLVCMNYAETKMFTNSNPAGPIFALKNYGWSDQQTVNFNTPLEIKESTQQLNRLSVGELEAIRFLLAKSVGKSAPGRSLELTPSQYSVVKPNGKAKP